MSHFIYPAERRLFRAGIAESATGPLYVTVRFLPRNSRKSFKPSQCFL